MPVPDVPEMTVHELKEYMEKEQAPLLLDVRQPQEYEIANLNGKLIPLQDVPNHLDELEAYCDRRIVVHCRSGKRSAKAVAFLRSQGFDAVNLHGGLLAWSEEIDASVPTY